MHRNLSQFRHVEAVARQFPHSPLTRILLAQLLCNDFSRVAWFTVALGIVQPRRSFGFGRTRPLPTSY